MEAIFYIFIFIFGTIIGSFLNVVICRHGTGRTLGGRSKCAVTGKTLKWFELIPIISFLIQGGRSRHSKTRISWQYPLVEFATGASFVFIAHKLIGVCPDPANFIASLIFYFAVFSFFILIFVYDLHHKIIPDGFVYPLMAVAFAGSVFLLPPVLPLFVAYRILFAGVAVALPILLIWLATGGRGMGFGDVLLAVPVGFLLGVSGGFAALLFAFWIGAVFGLVVIALGKKKMKSEIPFGPFIVIGFALAFLYNLDMLSIAHFFSRLL